MANTLLAVGGQLPPISSIRLVSEGVGGGEGGEKKGFASHGSNYRILPNSSAGAFFKLKFNFVSLSPN